MVNGMALSRLAGGLRRHALARDAAATDADLLGRFTAARDGAAFAELVRRHGPMVLAVCRRHLGRDADADDAFQAAFLVLARNAGRVRPASALGGWLHGVAVLCARKARHARLKRLRRERPDDALADLPAPQDRVEPDFGHALDDELRRLPERFRLAVLLCGPRGLTVAAAAAQLGWPVGTLASRLSRGRELLRTRLARRGLLGAAAGPVLSTVDPTLPPGLAESVIASALGGGTAPALSSLVTEVLIHMKLHSLRFFAAGVLGVGALALWGGTATLPQAEAAPAPPPAPPPAVLAKPKPALDRVKVSNAERLLAQEEVRREVGLSDDVYKACQTAIQKVETDLSLAGTPIVTQQVQQQFIVGGAPAKVVVVNVDSTETMRKQKAARAEGFQSLVSKLGPAGVTRMKQLSLQVQGARVLLDRVVIRELQLTAAQEDALNALTAVEFRVVSEAETDKVAKEWDDQLAESRQLLTPDQRKRYEALVGKPFATATLLKASPHFFVRPVGAPLMAVPPPLPVPLPAAPPTADKPPQS